MIEPPSHAAVPEKMIEWAHDQLKNLTPDEFISDPAVRRLVEVGPPAASLAARIQADHVDLAVLGSHGHSAVRRYILGTTSEKVLSRGLCPVLTVRL